MPSAKVGGPRQPRTRSVPGTGTPAGCGSGVGYEYTDRWSGPDGTVQGVGFRDTSSRRTRVSCHICGQPIELARMRDHLRHAHQSISSEVETLYLSARIEARRRRHG